MRAADSGIQRRLLKATTAQKLQANGRSEEHTSELQSPDHLVCRLLLEKKNIQPLLDVCKASGPFSPQVDASSSFVDSSRDVQLYDLNHNPYMRITREAIYSTPVTPATC